MIVVTCEVEVKRGYEVEYIEKVNNLIHACIHHHGILLYSIMSNTKDNCKFCWLEIWESDEDLQNHANSKEISEWRKIKDNYLLDSKIEIWHFEDMVTNGLLKGFMI